MTTNSYTRAGYCRYCGHDPADVIERGRGGYALGFCAGTLFGGMIVLATWIAWLGVR
jgi:glutamine amidotransferase-like uncharacterized protein